MSSFLPKKGVYPLFDLLHTLAEQHNDFYKSEKNIGYISIWYLYSFINGLISSNTKPEDFAPKVFAYVEENQALLGPTQHPFPFGLKTLEELFKTANDQGLLVKKS